MSRSLRKEPKWYLRDWAEIEDVGPRSGDLRGLPPAEGGRRLERPGGWGRFELGYLRDKEKREVDFLVVRDGRPWFLAEVKHRETALAPALEHFQRQVGAPFAFQVVVDADFVDADCFASPGPPRVVPARTLLSQLV